MSDLASVGHRGRFPGPRSWERIRPWRPAAGENIPRGTPAPLGELIIRPRAPAGRSGTYGRGMDDKEILAHIGDLIQTEHRLREQHAAGELTGAQEREQLRSAEEALDQCWDLLRQRRARREFGDNPNEAEARPTSEVESYMQLANGSHGGMRGRFPQERGIPGVVPPGRTQI